MERRGAAENADARSLDTLIDELVRERVAEPARIDRMGWSNGAFFSQEYALFRTCTPTPDGHRVAAVVAFGEKTMNGWKPVL
jgi:poly(3-hydroxybutyrate) depolymerase